MSALNPYPSLVSEFGPGLKNKRTEAYVRTDAGQADADHSIGKMAVEDAFLELLADQMAAASHAERRALVERAGSLFPARLRQGWRDQLLRRLARVAGDDAVSVRELGRRVDAAIALRSGAKIKSTGSAGTDSLVDRILLCGRVLTGRHVRSIIATVPLGKDQGRDFPN